MIFLDFDDDDLADLLSDEDSKPKAKKTANLEPASQPPSQPLDPPKTSAAASQNRSKTMQELFGIDPGTTQKCESNITKTGVYFDQHSGSAKTQKLVKIIFGP